jgi:hypothetical protein
MSDDKKSSTGDPHAAAGAQAARAASAAVPPGAAGHDELTTQMLALKRKIASSPELQSRLAGAATADEFHNGLVAIGAEDGVHFTPAQSKAFLVKRRAMSDARGVTADTDEEGNPIPPQTSSGCGGGYTHESANWCTWNPFKC